MAIKEEVGVGGGFVKFVWMLVHLKSIIGIKIAYLFLLIGSGNI